MNFMLSIWKIFGFSKPSATPHEVAEPTTQNVIKMRAQINRYPIKKMTRDEFGKIVRDCDTQFLTTCRIGTWLLCTPSVVAPETVVVGQIVKGEDMIADQWGAGLSLPDRGINRYRLIIAE